MMRRSMPTVVLCLIAGCGESNGSDLARTLDDFRDRSNAQARQVCGANKADISEQVDEDSSDQARCYGELAVEFDRCERAALLAHELDARAWLACEERDHAQLVECCTRAAPCSYDRIDRCRQELWPDVFSSPCAADMTAIEAAAAACWEDRPIAKPPANPCDRAKQLPVSWDEETAFGQTPAQTFGRFEGSCSAPYAWKSPSAPALNATPATGKGDLHIEISLEHAGVLLARPSDAACSPELAVPAHVRCETSDGLLREEFDTVLRSRPGDDALRMKLPADSIAGDLRLHSEQPGQLWLQLTVLSVGADCRGYLGYEFESERDTSGASSGVGTGAAGRWPSE